MSRRIKSTYRPKGRGFGRAYPQALIEVEEPAEELPIEGKGITPGQERKDEGASASPGPSLEASQQELAEPKTGSEHGDGPDVEGKGVPNLEPIKMPEAGEGKPQI
ncbi:X antigen family member 5-like [Bos indicus x Bos taurus]|uniref:X antigen family member 5-like n=2 Tax=Bos TaxID=9903 RepID=A0A4W2HM49_BOBOX|nr:PREDICTED: X antigen family member 5-like [Bos mutus]XP_010820237.1 X antigen family member 5 [Bos taurus]XP_010820238.1 X antigen family member 5 [Bos taurus]XP_010820239.1 X antigen family member 5 [Bos taurus]XP_010820240.1 X antigen family member 5 [Bos taurus]XP_010820241.1 X antigen family member 5 [Bos taurus]XP_014334194.1 PREDICTED: X antigen family member 5-like [Bos mutus]XP_014334197.1 PREDICTED: X antigen family member 5-like [Bos mutus]XP_014334202.1 PREDICTED: X antigen fa